MTPSAISVVVAAVASCGLLAGSANASVALSRSHLNPGLLPLWSDDWKPGDPYLFAQVFGTLHIGVVAGEACAWLGDAGPMPFQWPAGWSARLSPPELFDAAGTVVARGGQWITVGGGGTPGINTSGRCGPTTATPWGAAGTLTAN